MRKFTPLGDRVLVLPDAAPVRETKGLAVPQSQKEKVPTEGTVAAAGSRAMRQERTEWSHAARKFVNVTTNPEGVSIGQQVQFAKYAGRDVMHLGQKHLLLRLEEIEGVIEDVPE